jgi:soluble lytic murein transglycosylase-like protein
VQSREGVRAARGRRQFAHISLNPIRLALMARTRLYTLAALAVGLLQGPISVRAAQLGNDNGNPSDLCLAAIVAAERHHDIPHGLLPVMAKVESGRPTPSTGALQSWPWTVDADGHGIFFASKAEAIAWSRQALDSKAATFLDVGCMQVDLREHPDAFATLEQAFDPTANVEYGARFLQHLHDGIAAGNWFAAVGFYHSQTPAFAAQYRALVAAVAAGLPPPPMTAGHLSAVRLDLVGGGALRINGNRQPARLHHKFSSCQIASILGSYLPRQVVGCTPLRRR